MKTHDLICIQCPVGCALSVTDDGGVITVTGNSCPRGEIYGINEVTHPKRTVTSTVRVEGGEIPRVSVKTKDAVSKEKIFDVMNMITSVTVKAPVLSGDVVIKNVAGTDVDVIATKTVNSAFDNRRIENKGVEGK